MNLTSWCTLVCVSDILSCVYLMSLGGCNIVLKCFGHQLWYFSWPCGETTALLTLIQGVGTGFHIPWAKKLRISSFFWFHIRYLLCCSDIRYFLGARLPCWCTTFHLFYLYCLLKQICLLCICKGYSLWRLHSCWRHIIALLTEVLIVQFSYDVAFYCFWWYVGVGELVYVQGCYFCDI